MLDKGYRVKMRRCVDTRTRVVSSASLGTHAGLMMPRERRVWGAIWTRQNGSKAEKKPGEPKTIMEMGKNSATHTRNNTMSQGKTTGMRNRNRASRYAVWSTMNKRGKLTLRAKPRRGVRRATAGQPFLHTTSQETPLNTSDCRTSEEENANRIDTKQMDNQQTRKHTSHTTSCSKQ